MAAPRQYPDELRDRAIRMVIDAKSDPATRPNACRRIGDQLGIHHETRRGWVSQAEVDAGQRPGITSTDARRIMELERENKEGGVMEWVHQSGRGWSVGCLSRGDAGVAWCVARS